MTFNIKGKIAPVFTPFDESGNLELNVIPQYLSYLRDHGVKGILVCGTTGEFCNLTTDERIEVFIAFQKVAKALELKTIVQVGGTCLKEVIKLAENAEEYKADAIMTLPELYFKPNTMKQVIDYLEVISNAAPSLPLLYYNFPMMSGVEVNPRELFESAATRVPNFKGMKADTSAAIQVSEILREEQHVFIGNHLLAPPALLGFTSSIATVTNVFPDLVERLVLAVKQGHNKEARKLQWQLNKLVTAIVTPNKSAEFVSAMKAAMPIITGIDVGPPRQPLIRLTIEEKASLEENLKKAGFIRK